MDWATLISKTISLFLNKKDSIGVSIQIPLEIAPTPSAVDWKDPECQLTSHFKVKDACMLHSWNRLANESDGLDGAAKEKLIALCKLMELIREFLGCAVNSHCMFRSQKYNKEVVGAIPNDVHAQSLACDFDCNGHYTIEEVRDKLLPVLDKFNIRMEQGTATWIHVDSRQPGPSGRHFKA